MEEKIIPPTELPAEELKKARESIDKTDEVLRMINPRLFEDAQKQPSAGKRVINEQTHTEPIVYLESKGRVVDKMFLTDFLKRYHLTPGDLQYYNTKQKALFEYVKRDNPYVEMDTIKIASAGIFYKSTL